MKKILLLCILLSVRFACFAQWAEDELKPYLDRADKDILRYKANLAHENQSGRTNDTLELMFTLDTMRIARTVYWIEEDNRFSTVDMHNTVLFQIKAYDKLLNKYYRLLMGKLDEDDKIKLRDAQRVWLRYRDSEKEINRDIIARNTYMGGGTMWPLVASGRNLEIVKERVFNLYGFLSSI